jgi:hypothetical protein
MFFNVLTMRLSAPQSLHVTSVTGNTANLPGYLSAMGSSNSLEKLTARNPLQ